MKRCGGARLLSRLLLLLWLCHLASGLSAFAQTAVDPPADAVLDAARGRIDAIQKKLSSGALDDDALVAAAADVATIGSDAERIAATLTPQLNGVRARLGELGPGPKEGDPPESADVAALRASLTRNRESLDAQLKLSRLLTVESAQINRQISELRRVRFQNALGERTPALLSRSFWSGLRAGWLRDSGNVALFGQEIATAAASVKPLVWLAVIAAIAAILLLRRASNRWLVRFVSTRMPPGRIRRSVYAVLFIALATLTAGLIAQSAYIGLQTSETLYEPTSELLGKWVMLIYFGGFVAGLGRALLSANRPSWRLPPLSDRAALGLKLFPRWLAFWVVAVPVVESLMSAVSARLETAVAFNGLVALALSLTMAAALLRGEHLRRESLSRDEAARPPQRPLWLVVFNGLMWAMVVTSLVSLAIGYVALGSFLTKQVAWQAVVLATTYLLVLCVDDVFMTVLGGPGSRREAREGKAQDREHHSEAGDHDEEVVPGTPTPRSQLAVLLSGVTRLVLCLVALVVVVAPLGEGPSDLLVRAQHLRDGLSIGEMKLSPPAVLEAALVMLIGLYSVKVLQRWLLGRYLPTTRLEPDMYSSIATLLGYVGGIFVMAAALSALGLSLEKIAWLASALSVGIGFGLQAVVQNFVSGLILLAEGPVRVGDWVSLGGAEGDIKRINVRATEIQLGDRSTLIVPNSEFITKTVRNVTRSDPIGLMQIKLPLPLTVDVTQVRDIATQVLRQHEGILKTPAPNVFIDGVDGTRVVFNISGSVASPRLVYGVRSQVLFTLLAELREAGVPMDDPPRVAVRIPSPGDVSVSPPPAASSAAPPAPSAA